MHMSVRAPSRAPWPLEESPWAREVETAKARRTDGELLDLTCSNPIELGLCYPERVLEQGIETGLHRWRPEPKGLLPARAAVAEYYEAHGGRVSAEDVILTASTSEAYCWLLKVLCEPNDPIAVPRPAYPLLDYLAIMEGARTIGYSLTREDDWRIEMRSLEAALEDGAKAVVIVQPSNPVGAIVHHDQREHILSLCDRHGAALIVDEVFLDYTDAPAAHTFAGESGCTVFTLSGLSKVCALPQMKCAWIAASGPRARHRLQRLELLADMLLPVSGPVQHALPRLLERRHEVIEMVSRRVTKNLETVDGLRREDSTWNVTSNEGGWSVVLRGTAVDRPWASSALEAGVLVHPGWFYELHQSEIVLSTLSRPDEFERGVELAISALPTPAVSGPP